MRTHVVLPIHSASWQRSTWKQLTQGCHLQDDQSPTKQQEECKLRQMITDVKTEFQRKIDEQNRQIEEQSRQMEEQSRQMEEQSSSLKQQATLLKFSLSSLDTIMLRKLKEMTRKRICDVLGWPHKQVKNQQWGTNLHNILMNPAHLEALRIAWGRPLRDVRKIVQQTAFDRDSRLGDDAVHKMSATKEEQILAVHRMDNKHKKPIFEDMFSVTYGNFQDKLQSVLRGQHI